MGVAFHVKKTITHQMNFVKNVQKTQNLSQGLHRSKHVFVKRASIFFEVRVRKHVLSVNFTLKKMTHVINATLFFFKTNAIISLPVAKNVMRIKRPADKVPSFASIVVLEPT